MIQSAFNMHKKPCPLARELNYPNLILEAHLSIARIPFQHYSIRLKHAQQALILATQLNNFRKIDDLNRIISNITNARKRARDEDYHANVQRAGLLPTPQQPFN
jgi:hypothetical protein